MRLNVIQLLINSSIMMSNLFIPIFAHELHATGTQIGIIGGCYGAALFLSSYIFSRAVDAYPPKKLLLVGFFCSCVTFFIQMFAYDPISLAIIRALAGFSIGIYPAALILYVYNLKQSIGKFSSFMPLGWALGNLMAGIIAEYYQIFAVASFLFAVSFFITLKLPLTEAGLKKKTDFFSLELLKQNYHIYFPFFLRQIGANAVWLIFPLYLMNLDANKFWIGILYMLNPSLQFFIMRRLDRYENTFLIHTGDLLSMIAFIALIPLTVYYQAIPGLILIAFSFSFLYVGSINELIKSSENKGASAGLLNSFIALASIIGSFIGGLVFEYLGFRIVMATGAFFALVGYAVMMINGRYYKPQKNS